MLHVCIRYVLVRKSLTNDYLLLYAFREYYIQYNNNNLPKYIFLLRSNTTLAPNFGRKRIKLNIYFLSAEVAGRGVGGHFLCF